MKVPTIEDEASAGSDSSFDQEYNSQTSSEETASSRRKIKKVKGKVKPSVKPQIQKKKVSKPLRGKSGERNPIKGAKLQSKVKGDMQQNIGVKPLRGKSGTSKSRCVSGTSVDIPESGEIFPDREPEQNPTEGPKVQNKVVEHVHQKKVVKLHSNDPGSSRSQSPLTNVDIVGAYFVQGSGELVPEAEQHSIEHTLVFPMEKRQASESFLHKPSAFDRSLKKATHTLQQAEKEYSKDTLLMMSTLKGLSLDLKENTNAINNLCAVLQNNKNSVQGEITRTALVLDNHFGLPFETVQVFKEFDSQLKQDAKYRQHCAASLLFYIEPENHVSKSMTNIIKKFVGRDVALNFTAVKQTSKKEVLKGMKFYDIMFDVVTKHHTDKQGNPICEKYFNQCLGHALANAKDWDGFRVERAKKEMKKRLAEQEATKTTEEMAET